MLRLSQILFLSPLLVVVVALLCLSGQAEGGCGACNPENHASCINATSYYACINGVESRDTIFSCVDGYVCTDARVLCAPSDQLDPICSGAQGGCNDCNNAFACVSRTQYAQCANREVTRNLGTCPSGTVCDTAKGICVPDCNPPQCERELPVF